MAFAPGDKLWFKQTCKGGYGYQRMVPAVFVALNIRRASILVELQDGSTKKISVSLENLSRRKEPA